ncbi:MAG: sigma-70 family RNA polymerase sigma factor [Acidimicrobiia bacterium]|nr:MAG: sigma-70 family RNA polymerase sigma factor [Acidimicrobiia bacterium]
MARRLKDSAPVSDAIGMYLDSVSGHELLTAEDEVRLARSMEAGRRARSRLDTATGLDSSERARLYRLVREGEDARSEFIRCNLRLVVSIAKRYTGRGLELLDLVQEGNLGLIRAVEKFDWRKGFKFSTYATWWIRQAVTRGLGNQGRTIRLPVHMVDVVRTVQETVLSLGERLRRSPTREEIADASGLDPDRVDLALAAPGETVSLERPVGSDGDAELGDFVEDGGVVDPFELVVEASARDHIGSAMAMLEEEERVVIALRYGLDGAAPRTLSDVGKVFELTREKVRSIEGRALAKLRHPSSGFDLESLL